MRPAGAVDEVLAFWFGLPPEDWFVGSKSLDAEISERFLDLHGAAAQCELFEWRETPEGRLAEIIILDQFSRNLFRNDARAFATDSLALALAQEAVAAGVALGSERQAFLYMPYIHSESVAIQRDSLWLFSQRGLESNLKFAKQHKAIIDRFGRYPHRNAALGRRSTPEEIAFLKAPGSRF